MAVPVTCGGYGYSGGYPSGSPQRRRSTPAIASTSERASSCSPVVLRHAPGVGHGSLRLHAFDHCFDGFYCFTHCRRDGVAQPHAALVPILRAETFRLTTDQNNTSDFTAHRLHGLKDFRRIEIMWRDHDGRSIALKTLVRIHDRWLDHIQRGR